MLTSNWQFLRIKENLEPLGFGALLTQVQKSQKEKLFHNVICKAFCIALEVLGFRYLRIMMVLFQHPLTSSTYLVIYLYRKNTSEPQCPASFWFSSNPNDYLENRSSSHQHHLTKTSDLIYAYGSRQWEVNNSERPVDALAEKGELLTHWLTDNLKSRDASASKKTLGYCVFICLLLLSQYSWIHDFGIEEYFAIIVMLL